MLKNIVVTSLRNFFRNKTFSLINLIGLSVSMSLSMLIITIIKEQYSFDNFHNNSDQVYRLNTHLLHSEWGTIDLASAPLPLGQVLKDDYTLTENVVRVNRQFYRNAIYSNVNVPLKGLFVDPSFLQVFNFPFEKGDPATALTNPNGLVITKQTAERVFGTVDPLGQTISVKGFGEFTITGVLQEMPGKTHFEFEALCSMSTLPILERNNVVSPSLENWSAFNDSYVYIKIKADQNTLALEQALSEISKKYSVGLKSDGKDIAYGFYLHPLDKITPGPELSGKMGKGVPAYLLVFLSVMAGIVLLMSVFNFTNLTIAKSLTRAREIGVRKVVGAQRYQVFLQFIGEAIVFSLVALIFSYVFLQFLKTGFTQLSFNQDFTVDLNEDVTLYITFVLFAVGVGILAGVLPATYLSAFQASRVLKDIQNLKVSSRLTFRKILMVAQFTLSIIFVITVMIVQNQMNFMLTADYGIEQKSNINIDLEDVEFEIFANEVRMLPGVQRVGGVSNKLGTWDGGSNNYRLDKNETPLLMHEFYVDDDYLKNLSLTFLAGRNFDPLEQVGREKDIIVNESAIAQLGFENPSEALGETIHTQDTVALRIIGVVKDFHFRPLNNKIGPLALRYNVSNLNYLSVQVHLAQKEAAIAAIKSVWKKLDPLHPMEFAVMEQEIDKAYQETGMQDVVIIMGYATFLIISLACLGILGMAMYSAQVRAKEVGIRKVMGATIFDVLLLLSKSYLILIGAAISIGVPVSYFGGEFFLQGFPYRIQITPLLLIISVALIGGLSVLIIWSQTIKVAITNPVKWLRHE
ncbi:MAG: ABC transporter permease [Cytophagales bacterium]|nr:ABC transporter permease [Cytophagales bacterium]